MDTLEKTIEQVVPEVAEEPRHQMRVIDGSGDTRLIWDAGRPAEVDAARTMFNQLRAKSYNAFLVRKDGEPGRIITEFDPEAEKIIMAPPMAGG